MDEPENCSPKPFFHDTAYHTNMNEMDELALALNAYWERGMDSPTSTPMRALQVFRPPPSRQPP